MPVRLDPEKRERHCLFQVAGDFRDKRVLEVGCGNGRLTWLYADQADQVVGIDPDSDSIEQAIKETPAELKRRVQFEACSLDHFSWPKPFDVILMSWSL